MMVLVDTPVWSLALRRRSHDLSAPESRLVQSLEELIREQRAQLLGSTRQEILSGLREQTPGLREQTQFDRILAYLRAFENVSVTVEDYEDAARMMNRCRRSGITASTTDMLICAVSQRRQWQILSTDRDFVHYNRVLDLQVLLVS
jgi:predicted nucleic acid-binding protein